MPQTATDTPDVPLANRKGILEALVGLSILVSLAGVVMPIVGGEIAGSRVEQAQADMLHIVNGLHAYTDDTLFLPTGIRGRTNVSWLYGPGELPQANPFAAGGEARPLSDVLLSDAMGGPGWQGPYLEELQPDPWGRAYLVNVDGLIDARESAMVLSAGPNGICETSAHASFAAGDDVVLPIR
ncbi:MAG: type II secretion system protein GspG [Planctomycetes bacterium]|nr:type II secretion system protein GspG [Planctomycetota bacterium]